MLTHKDVVEAVPPQMKSSISPEIIDALNNLSKDAVEAENLRDNFINFSSVLSEGKFSLKDYVKAVMYVSFKVASYTNREAYQRTFPQRYQDMVAKGKSTKDIASIITAYNRGKLVNLVLERTIIPSWIINQDNYQKAVNVQVSIMMDVDVSPKVRSDAADSLMNHLKKPQENAVELKIGLNLDDGMAALESQLNAMTQLQSKLIQGDNEITAKQIAHEPMKVINP